MQLLEVGKALPSLAQIQPIKDPILFVMHYHQP